MRLKLTLFGGPKVLRDERVFTGIGAQPRLLGVLAILAGQGDRGIARERLLEFLWPDRDVDSARHSLKQALYVLRREFGDGVVIGRAHLQIGDGISSDLAMFRAALARGDLEGGVDVVSGEFLEGFHIAGASAAFEQWVDAQRTDLRQSYRSALRTLAERRRDAGDLVGALRFGERLARLDPFDTTLAIELLAWRTQLGQRSEALRQADSHVSLLHRELEVEPGAAFEQALSEVRQSVSASAKAPAEFVGALPETGSRLRVLPPTGVRRVRLPVTMWFVSALVLLAAGVLSRRWVVRSDIVRQADGQRLVIGVLDRPAEDNGEPVNGAALTTIVERATAEIGARAADASVTMRTIRATDDLCSADASAPVAIRIQRGEQPGMATLTVSDCRNVTHRWFRELPLRTATDTARFRDRITALGAWYTDPLTRSWAALVSPPSTVKTLEALHRAWEIGRYVPWEQDGFEGKIAAVAADTAFTMGQLWRAQMLSPRLATHLIDSLGNTPLSEFEQAYLAYLRFQAPEQLIDRYVASRRIAALAPASEWVLLQASMARRIGRYHEAIRLIDEWRAARDGTLVPGAPVTGTYWWDLDIALHATGQFARELAEGERLRATMPSSRVAAQLRTKSLAALGRVAAIESEVVRAYAANPRWGPYQPADQAGAELAAHGYLDGARRVVEVVRRYIDGRPPLERDSLRRDLLVELLAQAERLDELQRLMLTRPVGDPWRVGVQVELALRRGDTVALRALERGWADSVITNNEQRFARARLAGAMGDLPRAQSLIQDAVRHGFEHLATLHIYPEFRRLAQDSLWRRAFGPQDEPAH